MALISSTLGWHRNCCFLIVAIPLVFGSSLPLTTTGALLHSSTAIFSTDLNSAS
jgi:hypothetical protein